MAAAYKLVGKQEKRQLWMYPAGMGKSRIIVAFILAVVKKAKNDKSIILVYHHEAAAR